MELKRIKRPLIAGLLSALLVGLGQVYNRQLRKAILISATVPLLLLLSSSLGLLRSFGGLLLLGGAEIGFHLWVVTDAAWVAYKARKGQSKATHGWPAYVCVVLLMGFNAFAFATHFYEDRVLGIKAFVLPSNSMAPTIVPSERLIADLHAYRKSAPQRGDLVVFERPRHGALFIKRVVAVGGDVISGKGNAVILNGKQIYEPYLQHAVEHTGTPNAGSEFGPTTIPANQFFVLGDNRSQSLDSRHPVFGLVQRKQIKGKPLYIYWSRNWSRIGREIQ